MSESTEAGGQIDLFDLVHAASAGAETPQVQPAAAEPQAAVASNPAAAIDPDAPAPVWSQAPALADGKDAQAFRTIGEVAKALAIPPHVLRYWEEQFPMLRPVKRSGARRYYRPEDITLLERINRLVHAEGYTLRGARQLLETEAREARRQTRAPVPSRGGRQPPEADRATISASTAAAGQALFPLPAQDVARQLRAIRATLADALRNS